jgi:hypothetical protein
MSIFVTQSKAMGYLLHLQKIATPHCPLAFYYYFLLFFFVFIPGITQTRLPAALKAKGAAGGGRP